MRASEARTGIDRQADETRTGKGNSATPQTGACRGPIGQLPDHILARIHDSIPCSHDDRPVWPAPPSPFSKRGVRRWCHHVQIEVTHVESPPRVLPHEIRGWQILTHKHLPSRLFRLPGKRGNPPKTTCRLLPFDAAPGNPNPHLFIGQIAGLSSLRIPPRASFCNGEGRRAAPRGSRAVARERQRRTRGADHIQLDQVLTMP
jgi:hypothetical protein